MDRGRLDPGERKSGTGKSANAMTKKRTTPICFGDYGHSFYCQLCLFAHAAKDREEGAMTDALDFLEED